MIIDIVAAVEACQLGFSNYPLKIPVIIIFKHSGKIAGRPELCYISIGLLDLLEGRKMFFRRSGLFAHRMAPLFHYIM